jgi:hypothetical protein
VPPEKRARENFGGDSEGKRKDERETWYRISEKEGKKDDGK